MSVSSLLRVVFSLLLLQQAGFGRRYLQALEEWCWVLEPVIQEGSLTNTAKRVGFANTEVLFALKAGPFCTGATENNY